MSKKKSGNERYNFLPPLLYVGVLTAAVLWLYLAKFGVWPPALSSSPAAWAAFGDFVGGVLGPIFGLFGFALLLIQVADARKAADAARQHSEDSAAAQAKSHAETATAQRETLKESRRSVEAAEASLRQQGDAIERREVMQLVEMYQNAIDEELKVSLGVVAMPSFAGLTQDRRISLGEAVNAQIASKQAPVHITTAALDHAPASLLKIGGLLLGAEGVVRKRLPIGSDAQRDVLEFIALRNYAVMRFMLDLAPPHGPLLLGGQAQQIQELLQRLAPSPPRQ